jgi:hypothetical protein
VKRDKEFFCFVSTEESAIRAFGAATASCLFLGWLNVTCAELARQMQNENRLSTKA